VCVLSQKSMCTWHHSYMIYKLHHI